MVLFLVQNYRPPKTMMGTSLYFSDDKYLSLVPETRSIETKQIDSFADWPKPGAYAKKVIAELIAGPEQRNLRPTIPPGTRLLSLTLEDDTAHVNFSKELQTKHWGDPSREAQTIDSVLRSLTHRPNIKNVQFLIEGKKVKTLAGHVSIDEPLSTPISSSVR